MQLKQFYNIATKVSGRKKCYYFWWSTWLINKPKIFHVIQYGMCLEGFQIQAQYFRQAWIRSVCACGMELLAKSVTAF